MNNFLNIIIFFYSLLFSKQFNVLRNVKRNNEFNYFWWNQLTGRTLVLNARFGAWSKKAVIISLGGLPSRSGDYFKISFFLHHFFYFNIFYKNQRNKIVDPPHNL